MSTKQMVNNKLKIYNTDEKYPGNFSFKTFLDINKKLALEILDICRQRIVEEQLINYKVPELPKKYIKVELQGLHNDDIFLAYFIEHLVRSNSWHI